MKKPTPFGKYYLLERINVGGMAEVFRAKAFGVEGFERLVAVKRILPNIAEDKEFIRMFIEEAKLAVQLNHANIAQIYDLGVHDASYYIALEHVHGRDLRAIFDRCRTQGEPMPISQACFMVMKVCEGLDYAHNKRDQSGRELQLVHRDVSPQNVLISFEGEVKIIDFGIAKAAGKGSKTQAGILKGKFGYMSPEQVRGIPIDRRSDVFSCGIVLYELLTGERLFVGESDFSTLEKVRNVEILPPSTYNRRIPDELERIVLKALAKDTEERYQNAIDLHDELQAFVYTAGEFYSRKDLAGWMKKMFGREIEEETAKLESYRQLKPPAEIVPPAAGKPATGPQRAPTTAQAAARRSTQGIAAVGPAGPKPPPPPPSGRMSGQIPVVAKPARNEDSGGDLAWDDDELETQIYDNPEDDPRNKKGKQLPLTAPPVTPAPPAAAPPIAAAPASAPAGAGPDLSSLVSTGKGWDSPPITNGANGANGVHAPLPVPPAAASGPRPAVPAANGSQKVPTAAPPPAPADDPMALLGASYAKPAAPLPPPAMPPPRLTPDPLFDPMGASSTFSSGMMRQQQAKRRTMLFVAIGGAAVAVIAVVVIIAMTSGSKDKSPEKPVGSAAPQVAVGDQNTGFDLYVTPAGVMNWRLDGEARTDRLPSRIRGIAPGPHQVAIDAPPGFMSQSRPVVIEAGKAQKVQIDLEPIPGISGNFESTPPGADVWLLYDGKREKVGATPIKAPLDPRKSYQVLFEKQGYVSVNRPIQFTGQMIEPVLVNLEKAGAGTPDTNPTETGSATNPTGTPNTTTAKTGTGTAKTGTGGSTGPVTHPDTGHTTHVTTNGGSKTGTGGSKTGTGETKTGTGETKTGTGETKTGTGTPTGTSDTQTSDVKPPKPAGSGTLTLGSKPPCDIFIDGASSGLHTPQRELKLSAGKHKITLVNNEFGIRDTFTIEVSADQNVKSIKDYSDRIPK